MSSLPDGLGGIPEGDGASTPQLGHNYLSKARQYLRRQENESQGWSVLRDAFRGSNGRDLIKQQGLQKERDVEEQTALALEEDGTLSPERSINGYGTTERRRAVPPSTRWELEDGVIFTTNSRRNSKLPAGAPLRMAYAYVCRFFGSRLINLLFVFLPFGLLAQLLSWPPGYIFMLNLLGLIPLASLLGDLTEEVADHTGETFGGILNASFGNVPELIIGLQALWHNELRVVQASMLGSILSNLLFVTGSCFLVGGYFNKEQRFNPVAGTANLSLLFLASLAIVVPTPIGTSYDLDYDQILLISRVSAICLLGMYAQYIIFQLVTHKHLFEAEGDDDDEEDGEKKPLWQSVVQLLAVTAVTAFFSEFLVSSIDGMCQELDISKVFVGVVLLPLVGNATEHLTAVTVAARDRMELAMGIAVGSATQVAIFVTPSLVIASWIMGRDLALDYPPFEVVIFVMSIVITMPIMVNATSNWLLGSFLITSYGFCSFAFWFEQSKN